MDGSNSPGSGPGAPGAVPAPAPSPVVPVALHFAENAAPLVIGRRRLVSAADWVEPLYPRDGGRPAHAIAYAQPVREHFFPDPEVVQELLMRRTMFANVAQPSFITKRAHPYLPGAQQVAVRRKRSMKPLFEGVADPEHTPVLYELEVTAGQPLSTLRTELATRIREGVRDLEGWFGRFEVAGDFAATAGDELRLRRFADDPAFQALQLLIELWRTILWHLHHGLEFGCFAPDAVRVQQVPVAPGSERRLVPRFAYRGVLPRARPAGAIRWGPPRTNGVRAADGAGFTVREAGPALSDFLIGWLGLSPEQFQLTWYAPERFPAPVRAGGGAAAYDTIETPDFGAAGDDPSAPLRAGRGADAAADAAHAATDDEDAALPGDDPRAAAPLILDPLVEEQQQAAFSLALELERYANRDKHHIPRDFIDPFDNEVAFCLYHPAGAAAPGPGAVASSKFGVTSFQIPAAPTRNSQLAHSERGGPSGPADEFTPGREAEWGRRLMLGDDFVPAPAGPAPAPPRAAPRPAGGNWVLRAVSPPVLLSPFNAADARDDASPLMDAAASELLADRPDAS